MTSEEGTNSDDEEMERPEIEVQTAFADASEDDSEATRRSLS